MIRAILFDCDGVLIDSFNSNLVFFQSLMTQAGHTPPTADMYKKYFAVPLRGVVEGLLAKESKEEIERVFKMGLEWRTVGYRDDLLTSPEGMEAVIKKLANIYTLAVVTSRIRGSVFSGHTLKPVEKYFKTAVYYEDTKKHKPDPEPLLLATKKLHVKPEECIYIGDAHTDRVAADAAGMKIILYNKTKPDGDVPWTPEFKNLLHLVEILS